MDVTVRTPDVDELDQILRVLEQWQYDEGPLYLHPGEPGVVLAPWSRCHCRRDPGVVIWSHGPGDRPHRRPPTAAVRREYCLVAGS